MSVEHKELPSRGMNPFLIRALQSAFRTFDSDYSKGFVLAYVYKYTSELDYIQKDAYMRFLSENALDPTAFPSLIKFETEVVSMVLSHLHAPPTAVGSFTSGGTESCMLSMIAARNWCREERKLNRPKILLPRTAHAAFHKAAHLMDLEIVILEVDKVTMLPDPEEARKLIQKDKSIAILVGSAGAYSHGVVDPIEAFGQLAKEFNLWFHVDGCIGGFVLNYFRDFGAPVPLYDFRVEGVTSMSLDLHKYGYCPKGASTVLYRNRAYRKYQIFSNAEWMGYPIINPTLQSSKTGGPMAGAWATMTYLGQAGYRQIMLELYEGTKAVVEGIPKIEGLALQGKPLASLVAFTTTDPAVNMFHIPDLMKKRGWTVQANLSINGYKEHLHITVNPQMKKNAKLFLLCLAESMQEARKLPLYKEDREYVRSFCKGRTSGMTTQEYEGLLKYAGISTTDLPSTMARLNVLMDTLPLDMRREMMIYFSNDLMVHDEVVMRQQVGELKGMALKKVKSLAVNALALVGAVLLFRKIWTSGTPK